MTFRGFIAADVPTTRGLESFATELRTAGGPLKVVSPDQLHLTLKFLGDTEEGLVPEIVTAMREAASGIPPFEIRVRGTGAFPSPGHMNVIWVGVEGAEPLAKVAEALEASMEPLGFRREHRPWKAHVTLARVKGSRDLEPARAVLRARATEEFGTHRVDAIHLKRSVLTPQGAQYSIVESVRLEG